VTPLISTTILRAQSDERLVILAGDGHERAFEALVERYRRPLLRHVRRVLPEARAEDALQQAFLNAWSALQRGSEVSEPRAWLYRVAQNAALNALRVHGYEYDELRESLRSTAAGPDEDHERRWVIRRTLAGLAALPEAQREALLRTAVQGRSQEQVAAELGLSEGAVRGLVYRARTALRAAATAVTPTPLVGWAVAFASTGEAGSAGGRIAQVAAGGGTASVGAVLTKAGAVVAVTGVLATGAVAVRDASDGGADGPSPAQADALKPDPHRMGLAARGPGSTATGQPGHGAATGPGKRGHGHRERGRGLGQRAGRGRGRGGSGGKGQRGGGSSGRSGERRGGASRTSGPTSGSGGSGSSGSGGSGDDHRSGSGSSDSGSSGSGGSGDDGGQGSGTSGTSVISGSSGPGPSSSGTSSGGGPGPSGSGGDGGGASSSSGPGAGAGGGDGGGSSSSGPGSGTTTAQITTTSGSGSSGSGSSGSGSSGSGDIDSSGSGGGSGG
jgi:RNA polymerase sigma factor (sigma-70 family)